MMAQRSTRITGNLIAQIVALLLMGASTSKLAAAELRVPQQVISGHDVSISTDGSGEATFYLFGPATTLIKRNLKLGSAIELTGDDLRRAGRYVALLKTTADKNSTPVSGSFYVVPDKPEKVSFIARPSRVPVAHPDVITGAAFVFDRNQNMVLEPTAVKFELAAGGSPSLSRQEMSRGGIAWIRSASGSREGAARFVASLPGNPGVPPVVRVVQQVASDPCSIHMSARRERDTVQVETASIKDCSGNTLPDGTIVTFTETGGSGGRSSVDARVKQGIARATLPASNGSVISVASGVVLGNEIRLGGNQ